jgi:ADP-ribose pyrophosphatase YjhB (NUDIX family)
MESPVNPQKIRVKALAWIEDKDMLFVVRMHDSVKGDDYYRPVGGSVEFGERAHETVVREVREELDTEIELIESPFVVENHFVCDGKVGHEIDFLFPARFTDPAFYERKIFRLVEANGDEADALWIRIADCVSGNLRLVPEELPNYYANQHKGHHHGK